MTDIRFISARYLVYEGESGWNYMADVVADGVIDIKDMRAASNNFLNEGTYITNFSGVTITFKKVIWEDDKLKVVDIQTASPDSDGYAQIPQEAEYFTVKCNGTLIGSMMVFLWN
jgi:hypothetical protein